MRYLTMPRATTPLALAVTTALLAGCGGGGHSTTTIPHVTPNTGGRGAATFRITIPKRPAGSTTRSPKYVSSATQSLAVVVTPSGGTAGNPQVFNVGSSSPNCTPSSNGISCTIAIDAPPGSDSFDFTAYDQQNATGNKLSHGSLIASIVAGQNNAVTATLGGVVSTFSLANVPWTKVFAEGSAGQQAYTITAQDASGQTIIGTYDQPVTVTAADPSGAITVSGQFNASGDTVTASYNGSVDPNGGTLTFSSGSNVLGTATIAVFPQGLSPSFDPTQLNNQAGANGPVQLIGWYDAQDRSTMTFGSGYPQVTTIKDKSGNGLDLSTSIPNAIGGTPQAVPPNYNPTGGPAGRAILDFDSGKCLGRVDGFPTGSDYTIFVLLTPMSHSQYGFADILSGGYTGQGGRLFWFDDINGHASLARAAGAINNNLMNLNYAPEPKAPPSQPVLLEGDYASGIHIGSMYQGAPSNPDVSGGEIYLSGAFGAGNSVTVAINGTQITYTEKAGDTQTSTATALVNMINASGTGVTATTDGTNAPGQIFVNKANGAITSFSASGVGTSADGTVTDNQNDPSFALNCYDNHSDSSADNHIAEAVIFKGLLTSAQRQQLRTYFNRKWAQGFGSPY
jgi:hypothetical protein